MPFTQLSRGLFGQPKHAYNALALCTVLLAFLLRIWRLDAIGLGGDEAFGIHAAYQGLASILDMTTTGEPHPPLYYAFLIPWHNLGGLSEFSLRFPSLCAGVLTVAFLLRLTRYLGWKWEGLVAAFLFAINPYQIWYAQEARMYAPLAQFGIMSVFFTLVAIRTGRGRYYALATISTILALYTHYYALFLVPLLNLLFVIELRHQGVNLTLSNVRQWIVSQAGIAVVFLPWLAVASRISLSYSPFRPEQLDFVEVLQDSLVQYSLGPIFPTNAGLVASVGYLGIGAIGLIYACRKGNGRPAHYGLLFVAAYALLPLVLGLVVSQVRPMFFPRYFMVSAPAFYLALGLGVIGCWRILPALGIIVAVFLAGSEVYALNHSLVNGGYAKTDFPNAISYIQDHSRPGDGIVLDGWTQSYQFWYYHTLKERSSIPDYLFPLSRDIDESANTSALDTVMAKHEGVWLVDYDVESIDPDRIIEKHLARNYYQSLYQKIGVNRVAYYSSDPQSSEPHPLGITCDRDLYIEEASLSTTTPHRGEALLVALRLKAIADVQLDYGFSWRLQDQEGRTVVQRDSEPASGFLHTSTWKQGEEFTDRLGMIIPPSALPGQYSLSLVVYERATGRACTLKRDGDNLSSTQIAVSQITVSSDSAVASVAESTPPTVVGMEYDGLELIGHSVSPGNYRPGDAVAGQLFWHVTRAITNPPSLVIRLVDEKGQAVQEMKTQLGPERFPASSWRVNESYAVFTGLPIPVRATGGTYQLAVAVTGNGQDETPLFTVPGIQVSARDRQFSAPPPTHSANAMFSNLIELVGYDVAPRAGQPLKPGDTLELTLHWKCINDVPMSYKTFVHLLREDGQLHSQADSYPLNGEAPTDSWLPGEIVRDTYRIAIQPDAAPGSYRFFVGFYDPVSGSRIPLTTGGDGYTLPVTVPVAPQ